ncbi:hypothetical protein [Nitratifractor sp.]
MEKLNKIERLKAQLAPADFAQRLERLDWEAPDEAMRFYLKNFGIYNIKLRPESWMLRLRVDGGRPTREMLTLAAQSAEELGLRILLTARGQIELHDISPKQIYPLWRRFDAIGCGSTQTLTDNFRALTTDPLDGAAPDSRIDCAPMIEEISEIFCRDPRWIGTIPRKFNTALIGRETPSFNPWGNDLLFALSHKEGAWGFNLYLGGKNNSTAQDTDIFCLPDEAPALFAAVAGVYREHGPRGSRSRTRLVHLIEAIGMAKLRRLIEEAYGRSLPKAGELKMRSSTENRDHLLPIRRHGKHGEINAIELRRTLEEAQNNELRLTPNQELWIFDPQNFQSKDPLHSRSKIQNPKSDRHAPIVACAGSRYCPLSLWDVKEDLKALPLEALQKRGISLGFSGCLKGCGRHYHSDLGLIGLRTNLYGPTERAARIYLGALQAPDPAPGRLLYYSVPLRKLDDLLRVILEDFDAAGYSSFEAFSRNILSSYSVEFLQLWYLLRQLSPLPYEILQGFYAAKEESALLKDLQALEEIPPAQDLYEKIKLLSHRLWDLTQEAKSP